MLKKCKCFQFADDTVFLYEIFSEDNVSELQNDLNLFHEWCLKMGLVLNVNKTKHLRITLKDVDLPKYTLNGINIECVNSHEHLGIILNDKMCFDDYVDKIVKKSFIKWAMIVQYCKSVNSNVLLKLYTSYVMPIIEFASLAYYLNITNLERIEKIQRKVTKFICYKMQKSNLSYEQRLNELSLLSIKMFVGLTIIKKYIV